MVDFAMDVHRSLFPEKEIPQSKCQGLIYHSGFFFPSQLKIYLSAAYPFFLPVLALREKRTEVVAQLKQLQSETEPIVKMFEDPETTRQMQSTRYIHPFSNVQNVNILLLLIEALASKM